MTDLELLEARFNSLNNLVSKHHESIVKSYEITQELTNLLRSLNRDLETLTSRVSALEKKVRFIEPDLR